MNTPKRWPILKLSALILPLAVASCTSKPVAQQCLPMDLLPPAELLTPPQDLAPKLDKIIWTTSAHMRSNTAYC